MMKKYQVLARKYRPQRFQEVVGQETVVTTLKNALRFSKIAHAYLFCGCRGTGKTTLARLFAKALNCQALGSDFEPCNSCASCLEIMSGQSLDVIEIDGASNRGIDDIRQINETIGYAPSRGRYKIYIIDEVHMLTKEAFNALLKTLEEPPEKAKFFFATTEPHKILPTVISRCQRFDLGRILPNQIIAKLGQIVQDLGRTIDAEALHKIAELSEGSLRDAESLLDQILCFLEGHVSANAIREVFGLISEEHLFALDAAFSESRLSYAFELVEYLYRTGKDLSHFMEQLIQHYRLLSLYKSLGESAIPPQLSSKYAPSSRLYTQSQCLYLLEYLLNAETNLQKSLSSRIYLESVLLHVIKTKTKVPVEILVRRLMELEHAISAKIPALNMPEAPNVLKQSLAGPSEQNISLPPQTQSPPVKKEDFPSATQPPAPPEPKASLKQETPINLEQPKEEHTPRPLPSPQLASPTMDREQPLEEETPTDLQLPKERQTPPSPQPASPAIDRETTFETETKLDLPPLPQIEAIQKNFFEEPVIEKAAPPPGEPAISAKPDASIQKEEKSPLIAKTSSKETKHSSYYDTLMRFAAVELEGSLKL